MQLGNEWAINQAIQLYERLMDSQGMAEDEQTSFEELAFGLMASAKSRGINTDAVLKACQSAILTDTIKVESNQDGTITEWFQIVQERQREGWPF